MAAVAYLKYMMLDRTNEWSARPENEGKSTRGT